MDWTVFGNIVNILAALVTIGAPVFSIARTILHNTQNRAASASPSMRVQGKSQQGENWKSTRVLPWYIWVKVAAQVLGNTIVHPFIFLFYMFLGVAGVGAMYVFCFLVGIPTAWINDQGPRLLILCALLVFSLHYSMVFAEHAEEFLYKEVKKHDERLLRMKHL
jgi:hypothetical protein